MSDDERRLNEITEKIIGCAYDVANGLGAGFLEKVYENAMRIDVRRTGLAVLQQVPIPVLWRGENVGDYCAAHCPKSLAYRNQEATAGKDGSRKSKPFLGYPRASVVEIRINRR